MALSLLRSRPKVTRHTILAALFLQRPLSGLTTAHQSRARGSGATPPSTEPADAVELRPTLQQRSEIIALLDDQHQPMDNIARMVNLPYKLVRNFVTSYKQTGSISAYKPRIGSYSQMMPSRDHLTTQQRSEILTLFNVRGLSIPEIARKVSLPEVRVWEFINYMRAAKDPNAPTAGQPKSPPPEPLNTQQRLEVIRLLNDQNLKAHTISRITSLPYRLVLSLVRAYQKTGSIDKHPKSRVKTTPQQREDIISYYTIGVRTPTCASLLSIPIKTLYQLIYKYKKTADNVRRHLTTIEERQKIVASHEKGLSAKQIASRKSIPLTIVDGILKWYKETGSVDFGKRNTKPARELTAVEMEELRRLRAEHPSWPVTKIARECGLGQSMHTIYRFFKTEKERPLTRDTVTEEATAEEVMGSEIPSVHHSPLPK
jgi:transposase